MEKWKVRSVLVGLIVLLAGCASNAQYNSSPSGNVGTAWGEMSTRRYKVFLLSAPGAIPQK